MNYVDPCVLAQLRNSAGSSVFENMHREPSLRELAGLWKYKVRRFRIIDEIDRKKADD